jgi:hypothetical protein
MRYVVNGKTVSAEEFRGDPERARARFEEMVASRRAPACNTDATFLSGHCNGNQFEGMDYLGDGYRQAALEAGVDPKGKVYLGGLARFPGDPEAWVGGRGDVQRVLERRGWGSEGSVNVKPREATEAPKRPGVAEDLVLDKMGEILSEVPPEDLPGVNAMDVREKAVEQLTPHWEG